jgi:hypothetical protein
MTTVAKFQSRCDACDQLIRVGESILYARGRGAKHWTCPPKLQRKPVRRFPYILQDRDGQGNLLPSKTCPDCGLRVQLLEKDPWGYFICGEIQRHWEAEHGGGP